MGSSLPIWVLHSVFPQPTTAPSIPLHNVHLPIICCCPFDSGWGPVQSACHQVAFVPFVLGSHVHYPTMACCWVNSSDWTVRCGPWWTLLFAWSLGDLWSKALFPLGSTSIPTGAFWNVSSSSLQMAWPCSSRTLENLHCDLPFLSCHTPHWPILLPHTPLTSGICRVMWPRQQGPL